MKPLVSVIIPAYNNESTLDVALDSIRQQTYKNLEIIIVDDRSTDGTRQVAERHAASDSRVRVMTSAIEDPYRYDEKLQRNINAGWSARNSGLAVASGAYITFQDGDDASFLNRIETQVELLEQTGAALITTNWQPFEAERIGATLAMEAYRPFRPALGPEKIARLAAQAKGLVPTVSLALNRAIPFRYKRLRFLNKLFFGTLQPYPGASNSPLFRREVLERVRFRPLSERVWPSFMGRGADRDFHFQVAETFKNSYFFDIPLYLWRT